MYSSLPLPEHGGWIKDSAGYVFDWEDTEVADRIRCTMTKGCNCKKGCVSNNYECKKKSNYCGPGCECQGCINVPAGNQQKQAEQLLSSDDDTADNYSDNFASEGEDEDEEEEVEMEMEIITDEFFDTSNVL